MNSKFQKHNNYKRDNLVELRHLDINIMSMFLKKEKDMRSYIEKGTSSLHNKQQSMKPIRSRLTNSYAQ